MCEKCEQREHDEKILESQQKHGCSKCSLTKQPEIENLNREVTDPNEIKNINEKIDKEIKQRHQEAINGYDKQLGDCLTELARFSTKMLIMFEDYKKKGDIQGMVSLLDAIRNYGYLSQSSSAVAVTTVNMLIGKMQGSN